MDRQSPQEFEKPQGFPPYLVLSDEIRQGGMATVLRAYDVRNRLDVAIKLVDLGHDEARTRDSFMREAQALTELPHEHVVKLIEVDRLPDGKLFLVLEWVDLNLEEWIATHGPLSWAEFYSRIGRPILTALVYMQQREWIHRDVKPKNILVDSEGRPKIADYGVAKRLDGPLRPGTLRDFRSPPYTPPEEDVDRRWSYGRDCYSFAATAVFCLCGRQMADYGELANELEQLGVDAPRDILGKALSSGPAQRHATASILLAELETFEQERSASTPIARRSLHLLIPPNEAARFARMLDLPDGQGFERLLQTEFDETLAIERLREEYRHHPPEAGALEVRLLGARWAINAGWIGTGAPRLQTYSIYQLSPAELGRLRESAYCSPTRVVFDPPWDVHKAAGDLEALRAGLAQHEMEARLAAVDAQRERIFRMWYGFLREKAEFEARREDPLRFVARHQQKENYVLTMEHAVLPTIVGQARLIRVAVGVQIFCEILDAHNNEITIRITSGDESRLPQRGLLIVDTRAAQRALERQRAALDAVFYDRAVSPRLKDVLAEPSDARPPRTVAPVSVDPADLDEEKRLIVERALGLHDVLAVQGPPGTGKTRLIAEIVAQHLARRPESRILLASQTHIALDNVIERLLATKMPFDIVRVGKLDDRKIAKGSYPLLIDRKAEAWLQNVRARAEAHMTEWAEAHGLSRDQIEIGMLAERLGRILEQIAGSVDDTAKIAAADTEVQRRIDEALQENGGVVGVQLERAAGDTQRERTELEQQLSRLREQEEEIRDRLRAKGGYGVELADRGREDLAEWSALLIPDEPTALQCRKLLEILEDWLLRVGRSADFQAAILAGSNVIAGTCIGVASVRGLSDVAFDLCIVDEASKATATEVLVPMVRAKSWILVGDPRQLPPFFEEGVEHDFSEFAEKEVRETVLGHLLARLPEHSRAMLRNQYRMTAAIGDLISTCFYDGELVSPIKTPRVRLTGATTKPVTWLDTSLRPDRREAPSGPSFENPCEAGVIRRTLERIDYIARRRSSVYDVAVIAGYAAQVGLIEAMIRDRYGEWRNIKVECNTVDAFQGREAEICIYSATRSNRDLQLGFLREQPRLNVALSRGRSALIVVGDAEFFRSAQGRNPFRPVLQFIEAHPATCDLRAADVG